MRKEVNQIWLGPLKVTFLGPVLGAPGAFPTVKQRKCRMFGYVQLTQRLSSPLLSCHIIFSFSPVTFLFTLIISLISVDLDINAHFVVNTSRSPIAELLYQRSVLSPTHHPFHLATAAFNQFVSLLRPSPVFLARQRQCSTPLSLNGLGLRERAGLPSAPPTEKPRRSHQNKL